MYNKDNVNKVTVGVAFKGQKFSHPYVFYKKKILNIQGKCVSRWREKNDAFARFLGYDNYVKDLLFIIGKNNYLLSLGINTNKKFHVAIFSILTSKLLGN